MPSVSFHPSAYWKRSKAAPGKSPKIFLRDSGIEYDYLLANPIAGAFWEGFVIGNIIAQHNR